MSRKIMYLVSFALLVCLVGSVSAQPYDLYHWTTSPELHLPGGVSWGDPNSWITSPGGETPTPPPNIHTGFDPFDPGTYYYDCAGINTGVCNVDYGYWATPARLTVGGNRWPNFDVYRFINGTTQNNPYGTYDSNMPYLPAGILNVYSIGDPCDSGGQPENDPNDPNGYGLQVFGEIHIGQQYPHPAGILNVYGTAYGERLRMAQEERAEGILNVYDGASMTVGWWGCWLGMRSPPAGSEGASARIFLKGTGNLTVYGDPCTTGGPFDGIQMYNWTDTNDANFCNSHIDIEGGTIAVHGQHVAQLQHYVDNDWITSYGGTEPNCDPNVFYIVREWDDVNYPDPNDDPNLVHYTYIQSYGDGCTCKGYFDADMNQDCYVNMTDLAILADDWLKCTNAWDPRCLPYIP